jgi:eukaryotic-like serine/threonine-protein kinase
MDGPPLTPGSHFGRYRIDRALGSGGMGEVYAAFDLRLLRPVALKVLRAAPGSAGESASQATERLLREARAAAQLSHPNVVTVYDVDALDGQPYIAMELVPGASLRAWMATDVPVAPKLRALADVARALAAAHRMGIVHRDVKPDNVMMRGDGLVKVLDFGIARQTKLEAVDAGAPITGGDAAAGALLQTLTARGAVAGTPGYMAPEQLLGEPADARADQFAWGVTAYELVSGALPWPMDRGLVGLLGAVFAPGVPSLRGCALELPDRFHDLLERTLRRRPAERFASMDEMLAELEAVLAQVAGGEPEGRPSQLCDETRTHGELAQRSTEVEIGRESSVLAEARTEPWVGTARAGVAARHQADLSFGQAKHEAGPWVRRLWVVGAILVAAALAGGAAQLWRSSTGSPRPSVASGSGAASTSAAARPAGPTRLVDLQPSPLCTPDAATGFRAALQAFREANWSQAHRLLQRAQAADPDCPEVALQLVLTCFSYCDSAQLREQHGRAVRLRAALSERDRALLAAFEPGVMAETPSLPGCHQALVALAARYPADAEISLLVQYGEYDLSRHLELSSATLALDSEYADAWQQHARALSALGRSDEAQHAFEQCLRYGPGSTDCLQDLALRAMHAGRCDEYLARSREWVSRDAGDVKAYCNLALALAATSAPREATSEALDRCAAGMPTDSAALNHAHGRARLAALFGDFQIVQHELATMIRAGQDSLQATARQRPAEIGIGLYEETGEPARAAAMAKDLLARLPALEQGGAGSAIWGLGPPTSLFAFWCSCDVARHDGTAPPAFAPPRRLSTEWQEWAAGQAPRARTREEALGVLAAQPARSPSTGQPYFLWTIESQAAELAVRSGEPARELPLLREVAGACTALYDPFRHTRSQLWLGQALESTGDQVGACQAYDVVLARWGKAKPRSVTAEDARRRAHALGCEKP